ncbi:UNVERIFIED_CONTAM: Succinate-semialdehyde dehydrogenase (acetylating) [Sesamum calycinum]|uniref:Succinate-semialdehyde dehydrogenase (Acetylating) n=1 Tax=Sesamum calycinum TaxID=2727403 RepID=A0AAW2MQ09_9LAMI
MAFRRSSLLLRRAIGGSRTAAVSSSYSSLLRDSFNYSDCRRWYSSSESESKVTAAGYHVSNGPSYMRGAVFWEPNKPLTFEDFEMPRPKANEVLIKTKACGVCHSDLHVIKGELPFASPCVVGMRLLVKWLNMGHLLTAKSSKGKYVMRCLLNVDLYTNAHLSSVPGKPVYMYSMGGLAEFCVVPAHGLTVLPNSLPYTESAILGCAVFTAYGAMAHAAQVHPGDAIAVIGIGGVGSSCLQIARAFGASEIIAVDVQDEKLQKAKTFGATHAINARKEDAVAKIKEITGGRGVDVAVEALGRPQTFSQCVQSVRDGGKAVMIGLTLSGAKGEVDINHLVRRQIKVIGSYGGRARQDLPKLIKLAERGIFNLEAAVSRKCKFEEAGQAYKDLDEGSIVGRAVVEIM